MLLHLRRFQLHFLEPWLTVWCGWDGGVEPATPHLATPENFTERCTSGVEWWMWQTAVGEELFGYSLREQLPDNHLGKPGSEHRETVRVHLVASIVRWGRTKLKSVGVQGAKFKPTGGAWNVVGWTNMVPAWQPQASLNFSGTKGAGLLGFAINLWLARINQHRSGLCAYFVYQW